MPSCVFRVPCRLFLRASQWAHAGRRRQALCSFPMLGCDSTEGGRSPGRGGGRDPLVGMPLLPASMGDATGGALRVGAAACRFFDLPEVVRANFTIRAVGALIGGGLLQLTDYFPLVGSEERWSRAGQLQGAAACEILGAHRACAPPADRPRDFSFLDCAVVVKDGGAGSSRELADLKRGDLCSAVVKLSLPPAGAAPVEMASLSPRAGHFWRITDL